MVTVVFLLEKLSQPQFYKDLTRKTTFFEERSWFKFNNLGLALGTTLKFYTSVAKQFKLKVRKFLGLIPTFVEVTGEKMVGGGLFAPPPLLNRVKCNWKHHIQEKQLQENSSNRDQETKENMMASFGRVFATLF